MKLACYTTCMVGKEINILSPEERALIDRVLLTKLKEDTGARWNNSRFRHGGVWTQDGVQRPLDISYDDSFAQLLATDGHGSITDLLQSRQSKGLSNHVLDFMGGGYFGQPLSLFDSITGFRSEDIDDVIEKKFLEESPERQALDSLRQMKMKGDRRVIVGNIFDAGGYSRLREPLASHQPQHEYDVIFCRPMAPFGLEISSIDYHRPLHKYDLHLAMYFELFENMLGLMADKSVMYSQVPGIIWDESVMLARRIDGINGYKAVTYPGDFAINERGSIRNATIKVTRNVAIE